MPALDNACCNALLVIGGRNLEWRDISTKNSVATQVSYSLAYLERHALLIAW